MEYGVCTIFYFVHPKVKIEKTMFLINIFFVFFFKVEAMGAEQAESEFN
jgi:hypothetical protein